MDDEQLTEAGKAARNAKRAAVVAMIAVAVALVVAAIDQGIKRAVLDEVGKARGILDEFRRLADGTQAAGEAGDHPVAGVADGGGLVHDPGPRTDSDQDASGGEAATAVSEAGVAGGSPGDG